MSSELRLKKLRGSGGYVMATVTDEQQMKGNLGGPDLFLAPIGRLDASAITKHFCNTCEKEFEGPPKIEYENPNEEVAENLIVDEMAQIEALVEGLYAFAEANRDSLTEGGGRKMFCCWGRFQGVVAILTGLFVISRLLVGRACPWLFWKLWLHSGLWGFILGKWSIGK